MATETANLKLPYLTAAQSQPEVTVNQCLDLIDAEVGTARPSLTVTDGTTTIAGVSKMTVVGATIAGTSAALTLTVTPGGAPTTPVDVAVWIADLPGAAEKILSIDLARATTLPASLPGSRAQAATASTGTVAFSIQKNAAEIGTITFTASAAGVFAMATDTVFAPGDILGIVAPAAQDATLADISITLAGTR